MESNRRLRLRIVLSIHQLTDRLQHHADMPIMLGETTARHCPMLIQARLDRCQPMGELRIH